MAVKPILLAPDPVLKKKAEAVDAVDGSVRRLMDDMLETMYDHNGIGLAAPQIGVLLRVIVLDVSERDQPRRPLCLANPEIVWSAQELSVYNEGCLSFPDMFADVTRPGAVRVRYLDQDDTAQEIDAEGLLSTCLQHEIDHLNGILFVDHLSSLRRNMILRKMQKLKRNAAAS